MRKTKFVDLPVHEDTHKKISEVKRKRKAKSFDKLLNDMMKDFTDFDMGM